jgi:hypothetical protein
VEGGLGVVPGKETRKGEGAARVVEPCDSDSVRSRVEYGVLFYFPFFPFFCNFFYFLFSAQRGEPIAAQGVTGYKARGKVRPKEKNMPEGANSVAQGFREPKKGKNNARGGIHVANQRRGKSAQGRVWICFA